MIAFHRQRQRVPDELALPADGHITACDVNAEWTATARRYWVEAGVAEKIELRLGPALDTLDTLLRAGHAGSYDFAFIDADKGNYPGYYQRCLALLRPGGLIAVDNTLWSGKVAHTREIGKPTLSPSANSTRHYAVMTAFCFPWFRSGMD